MLDYCPHGPERRHYVTHRVDEPALTLHRLHCSSEWLVLTRVGEGGWSKQSAVNLLWKRCPFNSKISVNCRLTIDKWCKVPSRVAWCNRFPRDRTCFSPPPPYSSMKGAPFLQIYAPELCVHATADAEGPVLYMNSVIKYCTWIRMLRQERYLFSNVNVNSGWNGRTHTVKLPYYIFCNNIIYTVYICHMFENTVLIFLWIC